jgi:ribosomal protein S12 methylthiotransferase accessory factor
VVSQATHVRYWSEPDALPGAAFLWSSPVERDLDELPCVPGDHPAARFRGLVERLSAAGHRVLLTDLTTEDVAPLGLRVLRAVVPGLHPLAIGHRLRALGGQRLWTVPQRLGHRGIDPAAGDNPLPHPYP